MLNKKRGFTADPMQGLAARQVTVYRPDNRLGDGPFAALRHLVGELILFRSHIATIFRRDFVASYRGTVFGVFWNLALPLVPVSVYIMLATFRVIPTFEGVPSSVAIAFNATVWFLLAGCVQQPVTIVRNRNADAMKTALPLSASIASSFARLLFDTLVRLALVTVVVVATTSWPSPLAPLTPTLLAAGLLFSLGLGLLLAILNIVANDVERVVSVALTYGLFLSGVIFPLSRFGPLAVLETINPFAVFIAAAREVAFLGEVTSPVTLAVWSCIGLALFVYGARLFYLMEHRIRGVA